MMAREREDILLNRCIAVARHVACDTQNQCEANVFRLAAMVIQSRFPNEAKQLMQASEMYFLAHPEQKLAPAEVIQNGWLFSLPRLRDNLYHRLEKG